MTVEQKAKPENAETPEELPTLAEEEGIELTDDELESISGGWRLYEHVGS